MIFKVKHLPHYQKIGRLLWRHGRSEAFRQLAEASQLEDDTPRLNGRTPSPEEFVRDLEAMGPTFVKLGQVLSSRADLLPEAYLRALTKLQDNVEPFPFEQVEKVVQCELGVRLSKAFLEFEREPLAAASLGQVHRAVLRDGREVAVKVQRPDIRHTIAEDFEVLEEIATFLERHTRMGRRYRLLDFLEQFRHTLVQELDYLREASNLTAIADNLREFPNIRIARPVTDYTTRAVLTMDFINGQKITTLGPVVRLELNGEALADELFQSYLKQVLVDGLFHADPHPGNVFLTRDNRIALIDLGMVGRVTPAMQEHLIKLLLAVSEGRGEEAANVAIQISETTDEFDEPAFKRRVGALVAEMQSNTVADIDIGRALLEVGRWAGETGLFVPTELTMLGKALLQLHEIGRNLHPCFAPNAAIRRHVSAILNQRLKKDFTPGNFMSSLLAMKDLVGQMPSRIGRVFDVLGKGQLELKLQRDDTLRLLDGFQKVANRIAAGLLLAALIVGAALLMQVPTRFQLFGYPGMAIVFFLTAAAGAMWLLFDIFFRDTRKPRDSGRS